MWLGWEDALVKEAIPDWKEGIEYKQNSNGSLYVKVKTESGEVKEATIPFETINLFWNDLYAYLDGKLTQKYFKY